MRACDHAAGTRTRSSSSDEPMHKTAAGRLVTYHNGVERMHLACCRGVGQRRKREAAHLAHVRDRVARRWGDAVVVVKSRPGPHTHTPNTRPHTPRCAHPPAHALPAYLPAARRRCGTCPPRTATCPACSACSCRSPGGRRPPARSARLPPSRARRAARPTGRKTSPNRRSPRRRTLRARGVARRPAKALHPGPLWVPKSSLRLTRAWTVSVALRRGRRPGA